MWPLPRFLKPRDDSSDTSTVLSAACYEVCNNALLEAQSSGKNATLCDSGGPFNNYLTACNKCIDVKGDGNHTAVDSAFAPYIEFCQATNATASSSSIATSWPTTYTTFAPSSSIDASWLTTYTTFVPGTVEAASIVGGESFVQTWYKPVTAFSTLPEYSFHLSVGSLVSSYIPPSIFSQLAHSVSLSAGAASVTGDATSLIYAALEATSVPSWFSAAVPSTYSSQMHTLQEQINQLRATPISLAPLTTSSPTPSDPASQTSPSSSSQPTDSGTQTSKAWIAGPVVGGVAAVGLFAFGVFIYQRRRRRRAAAQPELEGDAFQKTGDKPQLHSDHLPPRYLYEMDASHAPSEADDGALPEMAANEVPARELATDDHHSRTSDGVEDVHPVASAEERENYQNAQAAVEARPS